MNYQPYLLETENLTKEFGDLTAVNDLTLKIREGEIFGFLGPNGAGKTTAIRMMVGLLKPTSGQVKLTANGNRNTRPDFGICPQDLVLWEQLTCRENLYFIGKMYDVPGDTLESRLDDILEKLNLSEKKDTTAAELSGGMKRKLNMGMSLMHKPEIVVLDEPSAGLDPQSRFSLWEYIVGLRKEENTTIILTTHLMEEADRLSDRVGIMDRGKMLVVDNPGELKKSVGEGDSVTIELDDSQRNEEALEELKALEGTEEVREVKEKLIVRALDAVGKVPDYMEHLEKKGFDISDISISRTNTLEDVFIHLTGRELE
ncbi:ABC transporter ATP-binding protein [Candidatus Bipolaricaulota bacterium]|nr:ABC transporter ATP-binding protein [Candidatus Bipolaricaulota bacterium]